MSHIAYQNLLAPDGAVSTEQVGSLHKAKNGSDYLYVRASAAIAAYQLCVVANDGTIAAVTGTTLGTTKPQTLCIPQFAFTLGDYGWAPLGPFFLREDDVTTFKVLAKNGATLNLQVYGTATAGSVATSVAAPMIQGLMLTASQTIDDTATACIAHHRLTVNA